jgi:hypothetical protein
MHVQGNPPSRDERYGEQANQATDDPGGSKSITVSGRWERLENEAGFRRKL